MAVTVMTHVALRDDAAARDWDEAWWRSSAAAEGRARR